MKQQTIGTLLTIFLVGIFMFTNLNCSEKENLLAKKQVGISFKSDTYDSLTAQMPSTSTQSLDDLEKTELVFIGTYGTNIFLYKIDTATGALSYVGSSPTTSNPSFLTIHSNKKWIYAVNENASGTISSFSFDTTSNSMVFLNSTSSQGNGPCFVSTDNTGKFVMAANYNSGSVAVCPINVDGSLGTATATDQHTGTTSPHAHMIIQAPNNFVYNTDLGLDKIYIYTLDTTNGHLSITGNNVSTITGAGPRHIAVHPNHEWLYVICELKGLIEEYNVNNSTGVLTLIDTISTLPAGSTSPSSADIHITPEGKYLYASNRGSYNNIAMYSINQSSGELSLIGYQSVGGSTPRNFAIDPSGKFLLVACQGGNKVITFRINHADGRLVITGNQLTVTSPVCLKFIEVYKKKNNTGIHTIH